MKKLFILLCVAIIIGACNSPQKQQKKNEYIMPDLAKDVVNETLRSWGSYQKCAWGHDALAPLSKTYRNWYKEPLYISPIDAYSTLYMMGLYNQAEEIENYVVDSLDFNKDIDAKVFEVNIRIWGGLLSMYELSQNTQILNKAIDFAIAFYPHLILKQVFQNIGLTLKLVLHMVIQLMLLRLLLTFLKWVCLVITQKIQNITRQQKMRPRLFTSEVLILDLLVM